MGARGLAKAVVKKLGSKAALMGFASEFARHLDPQQLAIFTNVFRQLAASEEDMRIADRVAHRMVASQVAKTIAEQMGGARRLKMMLGAEVFALSGGKGLGIKWPNRQRRKGNYVEITLKGDDTYTMEFFNVSTAARKPVKKYTGVYFDQLVDIFEKQTGWYLRI